MRKRVTETIRTTPGRRQDRREAGGPIPVSKKNSDNPSILAAILPGLWDIARKILPVFKKTPAVFVESPDISVRRADICPGTVDITLEALAVFPETPDNSQNTLDIFPEWLALSQTSPDICKNTLAVCLWPPDICKNRLAVSAENPEHSLNVKIIKDIFKYAVLFERPPPLYSYLKLRTTNGLFPSFLLFSCPHQAARGKWGDRQAKIRQVLAADDRSLRRKEQDL